MLTFALVLGAAAILILALQTFPTIGFAKVLRTRRRPRLADQDCPKAAVILCLRGGDPFLGNCLESLFQQDYPDFTIHVVVDSPLDPAYAVVQQSVASHGVTNVVVEVLTKRLNTCSLKGSSIVQALSGIDESCQIIAMLDSDVVPHATWLRELAAPLTDERIGVSSGTRWYMPSQPTWGGLIRFYWNAAATVQMYWNDITWGGSVALRAEIARDPEMLKAWMTSVSTDTVILRVVRSFGKRAEFVPTLMMINRETCDVVSFYNWVQRQMVVVRLYHKGWVPILIHGILMVALVMMSVALGITALVQGRYQIAASVGLGILAYWTSFFVLFASLEKDVRQIVVSRGEPVEPRGTGSSLMAFFAVFLTQWVYVAVLIKACFIRRVNWRGVGYLLNGPHDVELVSYQPYRQADLPRDAKASL